ncbi:DUF2510 domain-containing protein [Microbacterium sp. CR_7]|uniref:DUF2510 domain-containing protein n=1 Tax=Microbacterium sp. CR_7 TaxID=3055792 RepID=UPI0035C05546
MTTPAGWYDDGSGRQRWWDGTQWTEHFAPSTDAADPGVSQTADSSSAADASSAVSSTDESSVPESAAAAETAAAVESISAVESGSWEQPSTGAPAPSTEPAYGQAPSDDATPSDSASSSASTEPPAASEQASAEQVSAPESAASWSAPNAQNGADTSVYGASGTEAPPYANPAPSYPGAAASYPGSPQPPQSPGYGAPTYPGSAPSYPGAAAYPAAAPTGAYPGAYPSAPAAPKPFSVVGIIGLGLAALGFILGFIPVLNVVGFVLLGAGFIVSLISLFLKGRKWPGITGLILSVVGTIIAAVVAFVFFVAAVATESVRDFPSSPPSSDSSTDGSEDDTSTPTEVVEGTLGEPVTIEQYSGTSEITITAATWSATDGTDIPSTNGGFVSLDVTVTGLEGTSYVNPIYFAIETAEGAEGTYDYFADGQLGSDDLEAGDSVSGKVTFDVAQSASYTVVVTDEMFQEVARITVTPTAG